MKRAVFIFAVFVMMAAFTCNAQTDYSHYLDKAMQQLEAGDCESAQKFYNVYKDLTGKAVASVEALIADCNKDGTYAVGDVIYVNNEAYTVAYIRDGGKHGLAVLNKGWQSMSDKKEEFITRKGIPTLEEMKLIYLNRDIVRLYDIYWTCTRPKDAVSYEYYAYDFSTGAIVLKDYNYKYGVLLLIHRF